ncbi:BTB/POZ domain-containing protein [Hibiscus syriacus]|uniref:BTB/POZ domain-containing protein n=1 Tax=Hibiscus syriacus TaxID=106335 RepID=A0A6A2ZSL2_HIBSY|nr:BTB/POZ domain-containing protein [Hibiscus syriacus]
MSAKKELMSTAMKKTSEWVFSQEIPSDVTVHVGGAPFSLHKFPLVSKCGYIRKVVSESNDADLSVIEIPDVPGGSDAFEFAAKFCYGINFEISTENIALLRCVAEYLEMTEDYAVGNLVGRTEAYLNEMALKSLAGPDLAALRIDIFERVLIAMIARGFKHIFLFLRLCFMLRKLLEEIFGKGRKRIEPRPRTRERDVLETIVRLLPRKKNAMSVSFLSVLLRAAIYLETTAACRLDLEKRMALQLGQAVLDDSLIPSYSFTGIHCLMWNSTKIMMNYLNMNSRGWDVQSLDIYLKHNGLPELSREACAHAAQMTVFRSRQCSSVYHEQQRLQDVTNGSIIQVEIHLPFLPGSRKQSKGDVLPSSDKPPFPRKSFMNSISKKLGQLNPFPTSGARRRTRQAKTGGIPYLDT